MQQLSTSPAGPKGGQVACSACGGPLDPLRAGHVGIFNGRFHFFCDYGGCRARFLGQTPEVAPKPVAPPLAAEYQRATVAVQPATTLPDVSPVPERIAVDDDRDLIEPVARTVLSEAHPAPGAAELRDVGMLLVALALIAGMLAMALELAETSALVNAARLVLLVVGCGALAGRAATMRFDAASPRRFVVVAAPLLAIVPASWAAFFGNTAEAGRASFLAATVLTVAAINVWLVAVASRPVEAGRRWLEAQLEVPGRRGPSSTRATVGMQELVYDLAPGDAVLVHAGEVVPVDLTVEEGEAQVLPWIGATSTVRRRAGDTVVAGSRVTTGELRGRCVFAGAQRVLARPLLNPERRLDVHSRLPRLGRALAERWAVLIALTAALVTFLFGGGPLYTAMAAVAVYAAFSSLAVGSLAGLSVANGVLAVLGRGVVYHHPEAWDRSAQVTAAVFCARGTLLRGEPELAELELFRATEGGQDADDALALAAGALSRDPSPAAIAVRRAATERGLASEPMRNLRVHPGSGVSGTAVTGESVCVGSRALLLEQRVSVAAAERQIHDLEAIGRTVLLVAKAGRLSAVIALKDGLRSGARAAVQLLLDGHIEPVLMSADSSETCQALGRALDIDHLRAEVADDERGEAVVRLKEAGGTVAVIGHAGFDDDALREADVSVALAAAGGAQDEFSVSLVTDDIRDASLALALAHRTRAQASVLMVLLLGPATLGGLVVVLGLLPPEYAPLAQLLGALAAVWQLSTFERSLRN